MESAAPPEARAVGSWDAYPRLCGKCSMGSRKKEDDNPQTRYTTVLSCVNLERIPIAVSVMTDTGFPAVSSSRVPP